MTTASTSSPLSSEPDRPQDQDQCFSASAVLHHHDGSARVYVSGALGPATAPVLGSMLDGLVTDGVVTIVVDLSDLDLCTSHGLDVLERARDQLSSRGGGLSLENATGVVRRVLDAAGTDLEGAR